MSGSRRRKNHHWQKIQGRSSLSLITLINADQNDFGAETSSTKSYEQKREAVLDVTTESDTLAL